MTEKKLTISVAVEEICSIFRAPGKNNHFNDMIHNNLMFGFSMCILEECYRHITIAKFRWAEPLNQKAVKIKWYLNAI